MKVPPETDLALFAPLGCGVQTGAGAVLNVLDVREGSTLAVFGVGSVGMSAVMAGKLRKARTIIAVDVQPGRLELAKSLGATHAVLGSGDVVAEIRKICPPVGVDFAVDCTGITAVIGSMVEALGTRGRAATAGAPGFGSRVSLDVMDHLTYGKEYVGCCEGDSLPSEVSDRRPISEGHHHHPLLWEILRLANMDLPPVHSLLDRAARKGPIASGEAHYVLRRQGLRESYS